MTNWLHRIMIDDDALLAACREALAWRDRHVQEHDAVWVTFASAVSGMLTGYVCEAVWPDGTKCERWRLEMAGRPGPQRHTRYVDLDKQAPSAAPRGHSVDYVTIDEAQAWARQNGKGALAARILSEMASPYAEARRQYAQDRGEWGDG